MSNWFVDTYEAAADAVGSAVSKSFDFLFGDDKAPVNIPDGGNGFQSDLDISGGWSNNNGFDAIGLGGEYASKSGDLAGGFASSFGGDSGGILSGLGGTLSNLGGDALGFLKENPEVAVGLLGGAAQTIMADKEARERRKHETALNDRQHQQQLERLQKQQEHYLEQLEQKNEDENERYWVQAPTNVDASRLGGRHWATRRNRNGNG